jgi:hypothetical protein
MPSGKSTESANSIKYVFRDAGEVSFLVEVLFPFVLVCDDSSTHEMTSESMLWR